MAHNVEKEQKQIDKTVTAYEKNNGSVRATAQELGVSRRSVNRRIKKAGLGKKPLVGGSLLGVVTKELALPKKGEVKRYILTSAQNNTYVNDRVWKALNKLAEHYDAEIFVGTYSYNQNAYGQLAVKAGKCKGKEKELWFDPQIEYFLNDNRIDLAPGLVWCGEMNILPSAVNPLAGLESYSARKSAIFPHAKLAMRSVPTMQGEGTKLNYTTGTVTQRNYIQKRAGLVAEHHHIYGGLLVEVNHHGNWWVRQLNASDDGAVQDLDVLVKDGKLTVGNHVEAITWGDLHATIADEDVIKSSMEMLDTLKPQYQFLHDVLEGASLNHHEKDNPHIKFYNWLRGLHKVEAELRMTAQVMGRFARPGLRTVVVDSNHDDPWIQRWLREYDYRKDPANAEFFLKAQAYLYAQIRLGKMPRDISMLKWCLLEVGLKEDIKFLVADESYTICDKRIECGMHGYLGPNGRFGSPEILSKMGRRSNTAHTHAAGIYNGVYVAGTSTQLRWSYNRGPSSWNHSHVVTYPTGKRAIVTIYNGEWRAR